MGDKFDKWLGVSKAPRARNPVFKVDEHHVGDAVRALRSLVNDDDYSIQGYLRYMGEELMSGGLLLLLPAVLAFYAYTFPSALYYIIMATIGLWSGTSLMAFLHAVPLEGDVVSSSLGKYSPEMRNYQEGGEVAVAGLFLTYIVKAVAHYLGWDQLCNLC